jgi:hypothetical protein
MLRFNLNDEVRHYLSGHYAKITSINDNAETCFLVFRDDSYGDWDWATINKEFTLNAPAPVTEDDDNVTLRIYDGDDFTEFEVEPHLIDSVVDIARAANADARVTKVTLTEEEL